MTTEKTVLLIMGSARAGRLCPRVAEWVRSQARLPMPAHFEVIDLTQWSLPLDDEPAIPASGRYAQPHTRAWSEKIQSADAVIFVSPQYNWGYPAALKNAIDHLYREWRDKPVMLVTYGGHGGTKCSEQLRQVGNAVKMRLTPTAPALQLPDAVIREGVALNPEIDFASHVAETRGAFDELAQLMV